MYLLSLGLLFLSASGQPTLNKVEYVNNRLCLPTNTRIRPSKRDHFCGIDNLRITGGYIESSFTYSSTSGISVELETNVFGTRDFVGTGAQSYNGKVMSDGGDQLLLGLGCNTENHECASLRHVCYYAATSKCCATVYLSNVYPCSENKNSGNSTNALSERQDPTQCIRQFFQTNVHLT